MVQSFSLNIIFMENTNYHQTRSSISPHASIPIITHLIAAYELWHGYMPNIPKDSPTGI
jgi:hypothetical protein